MIVRGRENLLNTLTGEGNQGGNMQQEGKRRVVLWVQKLPQGAKKIFEF